MLHVRKQLKPDNCFLWVVHNEGTEQFKSNSINNFSLIYNAWIRELSWRTLQEACNHVKKLQILCPGMFNLRARNRIFLFFVEFLAWKRVWKRCFKFAPNAVYSTFEKAASAKAFYLVAEDLKIGKRVHWMHGMRHSSLQATLATDIWCMTDADVNYFEAIVSSACIVRKKPSPEAQEMIAKGGMVDISYIRAKDTKNFLYLGVNLISSYDRKMRLEDLKIVKRAQVKYGESVRWRFRPHPGAIKQFHKDLHDAGIEAGDFSSQSLIEDVLWADAIGSPFSSILIDAHETGRPVFWMQSFIRPFGGAAELIEAGIGSLCDMDFIDNDFAEAIGIDS